ncbi:hypothetical protein WJX75_009129 [Coccomyxa subellipsoidea]|uniref:Uncharacterized protein n=1 Tax=Coccomyxa subellipsoidea TaxID=248742 RepID=A0ABR2YDE1_9CHLO
MSTRKASSSQVDPERHKHPDSVKLWSNCDDEVIHHIADNIPDKLRMHPRRTGFSNRGGCQPDMAYRD